jgi:hypothetical protein
LGGSFPHNSGASRGENAIVCGIGFMMNFEFLRVIPRCAIAHLRTRHLARARNP